jgi:hypothetical protein
MRSGTKLLVAFSLAASVAACSKEASTVITEFTPSSTLARVRVLNTTNTTLEMSSPAGEWAGINRNIRHGVSRCFELAPSTAPLVRDSATQTELTGLPTNFEAGKSYALLIYRPTTTATTYSYLSWETDSYIPPVDSGGFRVLNASPNAGGVDVYVNIPNAAAVPAMTAANRVATNVPLATAMNYLNLRGGTSYQVRITRTGSTTTANTLIDGTATVIEGESMTYVLGIPAVGATAHRSFTAGGC